MGQKEDREKEKTSRETLGKFFYDLAKTSFAAMTIGGVVGFFENNIDLQGCVILLFAGLYATVLFASLGFYIFKIK